MQTDSGRRSPCPLGTIVSLSGDRPHDVGNDEKWPPAAAADDDDDADDDALLDNSKFRHLLIYCLL